MTVRFLDLQSQYQSIKNEVDQAVLGVLASGQYVLGPEVERFEQEFAAAHGAAEGIAVNSGTSALHLALLAAGIGPGDEVIVPSMTFTATAAAISYTGASPVFVDIDPHTFTINPALVEERITARTRAIIPVHLYGQGADLDPLLAIAENKGLVLIEDAAQAHLGEYRGRRVGGIGHCAAFSFYPGKNLGAYGEGGLVTTNDPALGERIRLLRDWGQKRKYHHETLAYNYRMDAVQGAVLRVKLSYLEDWTNRRRRIAARYQARLGELGLSLAREAPDRRHVYHIFSLFHPKRDQLQKHLGNAGIQTGNHYPIPVHLQQAYAALGYREGDLPVTERVAREQLSLPLYAELPDSDVERVCNCIEEWIRNP